jgi:3-oxoacyl-[acyl-carrier protein] reductase
LAKEGAKLIINGRNKENLESTKKEIEKINGAEVMALAGDLSTMKKENRSLKLFTSLWSCRYFNYNTGGPPSGKFEDFKLEDWDTAYKSSACKCRWIDHWFFAGMKQQRWGELLRSHRRQ